MLSRRVVATAAALSLIGIAGCATEPDPLPSEPPAEPVFNEIWSLADESIFWFDVFDDVAVTLSGTGDDALAQAIDLLSGEIKWEVSLAEGASDAAYSVENHIAVWIERGNTHEWQVIEVDTGESQVVSSVGEPISDGPDQPVWAPCSYLPEDAGSLCVIYANGPHRLSIDDAAVVPDDAWTDSFGTGRGGGYKPLRHGLVLKNDDGLPYLVQVSRGEVEWSLPVNDFVPGSYEDINASAGILDPDVNIVVGSFVEIEDPSLRPALAISPESSEVIWRSNGFFFGSEAEYCPEIRWTTGVGCIVHAASDDGDTWLRDSASLVSIDATSGDTEWEVELPEAHLEAARQPETWIIANNDFSMLLGSSGPAVLDLETGEALSLPENASLPCRHSEFEFFSIAAAHQHPIVWCDQSLESIEDPLLSWDAIQAAGLGSDAVRVVWTAAGLNAYELTDQ